MVEAWKLAADLERAIQADPEKEQKARRVLERLRPSSVNDAGEMGAVNLFTAALVNGRSEVVDKGNTLLQQTYKATRKIGDHEASLLVRAVEVEMRGVIASVLGEGLV